MNEVNTGGSVNAIASDCSSRDGGQSEGNPSVQAGTELKQFRKVMEQRLSEWHLAQLTIDERSGFRFGQWERDGYKLALRDLDVAIAEAEGCSPTMGE